MPVGVGGPAELSVPLVRSIANTEMLSAWELATYRYLPEGSTLRDSGPVPVGTGCPIDDNAPVLGSTV